MLLGQAQHQLDDKSRLRLPSSFRRELSSGYIIMRGTSGCLFVFSKLQIAKLYEKIEVMPLTDIEAWKPIRALLSSAFEVTEDTQGRFVLPQNLKEFAGITKNVVIIGVGTRAEIWSEESWQKYNLENEKFDSVLQGLKNYNI